MRAVRIMVPDGGMCPIWTHSRRNYGDTMTVKDAMEKIETMQEEIRWVFPMDFSEALDMALDALRSREEERT